MESVKTNDVTTEMCPTQKMSHRKWKAMMRKQKRRAKRQLEDQQKPPDKAGSVSESEDEAALQAQEEERQRQHQLFLEREKKAEEEWLAKQEREKKEKERRLEAEQKIREEWEERQKKEQEEEEEREKIEREKKEKQVTWSESLVDFLHTGPQPTQVPLKNVAQLLQQATANDNKDAWHNPIAPVVYGKERDQCPFFMKTGACRFAERCSRSHTYPESSCTIMLPGMFANFRLEQSLVDENDTDLALEYDDKEMYDNFTEFYNDVLPEFRSMGRVIQFKVSCNCEPHLRGNVYVQYRREDDAQKAFVKFNGRWYGGRQISCVFINIARWKSAICGQSFVKRCPKGKSCNFLHVFRNPGNEFWLADKDYEMSERDHRSSDQRDSHHRYGSDRRDRYSHRDRFDHNGRDRSYDSRYKSRRHDRSRSRSRSPKWKGGNRSRSRSPSRSRRKRSRSRSLKSRSPSRSVRHRSGSRSPKSRRLKHRKSRSPVSPDSRSPSRSSKRRSRSKGRRSRSPSHSMENVRTSSNGQSHGTHKAEKTESSTDSGSENSRSSRSVSKTKHKKSKKHKKHKHKSQKKKNSEKDKTKAKVKSISDPESVEDRNGNLNIIEIPQDSGEEDLGDVIFEDVYV